MIDKIFNPSSVAIIGATERENSVGRSIVENLLVSGIDLFFVNSRIKVIFDKETYSNITEIKENIDLAVVVVPKIAVSKVIDDCVEKKVGGVVIISSGFAEEGEQGKALQKEIKEKLDNAEIPFVGPNSLGILRPPLDFNVSFSPGNPNKGGIAFISQSGGLIDALIDGSETSSYGFSFIVSVGNAAGLDIADYINFINQDENTKVIALYIEGVKDGRKLFEAVKSSDKPIIILKAGRTPKTIEAVSSHTGSLAGEYRIFSAALKQAGAFEVDSFEELFDTAKALDFQNTNKGDVGIVTNGGGAGVLIADLIYESGLSLAKLEGIKNPYDILGDASCKKYKHACEAVIKQKEVSQLVVIQTPQAVTEFSKNVEMITELQKYNKPIVTVLMGFGKETKSAINYLEKSKIPSYSDPRRAIKPILALSRDFKK